MLIPPRTPLDFAILIEEVLPETEDARDYELGDPETCAECGELLEDGSCLSCEDEEQWCVEPVPALGGLTPLEAAADPTRREEVIRLIDSFDRRFGSGDGELQGFRPARLRQLLGLD